MNEELVTKVELASQLAVFKTELKTEIRAEFKAEIGLQITELRTEMFERMEKVETTLLNEFRKYAIRSEARLRVNEVSISGLTDRMVALEERMTDLEQR